MQFKTDFVCLVFTEGIHDYSNLEKYLIEKK